MHGMVAFSVGVRRARETRVLLAFDLLLHDFDNRRHGARSSARQVVFCTSKGAAPSALFAISDCARLELGRTQRRLGPSGMQRGLLARSARPGGAGRWVVGWGAGAGAHGHMLLRNGVGQGLATRVALNKNTEHEVSVPNSLLSGAQFVAPSGTARRNESQSGHKTARRAETNLATERCPPIGIGIPWPRRLSKLGFVFCGGGTSEAAPSPWKWCDKIGTSNKSVATPPDYTSGPRFVEQVHHFYATLHRMCVRSETRSSDPPRFLRPTLPFR